MLPVYIVGPDALSQLVSVFNLATEESQSSSFDFISVCVCICVHIPSRRSCCHVLYSDG